MISFPYFTFSFITIYKTSWHHWHSNAANIETSISIPTSVLTMYFIDAGLSVFANIFIPLYHFCFKKDNIRNLNNETVTRSNKGLFRPIWPISNRAPRRRGLTLRQLTNDCEYFRRGPSVFQWILRNQNGSWIIPTVSQNSLNSL